MRVLFITRKWPPAVGGMETYSRELARELESLTTLEVRALPGRPDGSPPGPLALLAFLLGSAVLLLRRRNAYDLVHFGDFVLFPLAWLHSLAAPGVRRVVTVHGLDVIFGNRQGFLPALYRRYLAWARRRRGALDAIVVNSRNTARLVEAVGLGESRVVPLGVRIPDDAPPDYPPPDPEDRYLLFVGRLVPRKGAAWFAEEVLPLLPEDVRLRVVGKAWDAKEQERLRAAPRVELLGFVDDARLQELRARAIAVVMPNIPSPGDTDVEGFGLTALEASLSGAPLVASDLEGIADAVVDGETGFLVEPLRPELWARTLDELVQWDDERRRTFARGAREVIARDFSWGRVARETLEVYASGP